MADPKCGETIAKKNVQLPSQPIAVAQTNSFTKQSKQDKPK